jgi:hypothetical protein
VGPNTDHISDLGIVVRRGIELLEEMKSRRGDDGYRQPAGCPEPKCRDFAIELGLRVNMRALRRTP